MSVLRSLLSRKVGTYAACQACAMSGRAMLQTLLPWFMLGRTQDPTLIAWLANGNLVAAATLNPLVGSLSDRFGARRVLMASQLLQFLYCSALAALVWTNAGAVFAYVVLAWLAGAVTVVEDNARHSFVKAFGAEHLVGLVSINAALMNAARVIGPAVGAWLYGSAGFVACLCLCAASYLGVIANLATVPEPPRSSHPTTGLFRGFAVIWRSDLKFVVSMAMVSSFAGHMFLALPPLLAKYTYHGDATTLAGFSVAMAIGSMSGILSLGRQKELDATLVSVLHRLGLLATALVLLGFAAKAPIWITWVLFIAVGFGLTQLYPTYASFLHARVEDGVRARTMSAYASSHYLLTPLATALSVWLFEHVSARSALFASALACAAGLLVYFWARRRSTASPSLVRDLP